MLEIFEHAPVATEAATEVTITGIQMSFEAMVLFMLKWALASIPAGLILFALGALLVRLLQALA